MSVLLPILLLASCYQKPYTLHTEGVSKTAISRVQVALEQGLKRIDDYFGKPFPHTFEVIVAPHRSEFDRETAKRWKMPPSAKWMVGAGVSNVLILLSPEAWKVEAVEHDGSSDTELGQIVAHELTHVYHGQFCPKPDFDGMDEMGWFAEGLAAMVSGQLDGPYKGLPERAVDQGKVPKALADAWSGPYRYGVSGSMVRFAESLGGKRLIVQLMGCTTNSQALKTIGMSEKDFLDQWEQWVLTKDRPRN